jgi:adenylate cyclase
VPLEAVLLLEEAIAREDDGTDVGLRIWSREAQGWAYFVLGRLAEALTSTDEGIALGQADPHVGLDLAGYRPYLGVLWVRARVLGALGRLTEAAHGLEQALAQAERYGDWVTCGALREVSAQLCDFTGDVRAAVAHGRAAVEVAEKTGNNSVRVLAFGGLGLANVLDGQGCDALDALGQALAIARERRAGLQVEAQLLAHLARAQLGLGDVAAARATAEEAVAVAQRRGTRFFAIEADIVLARALIQAGARRDEVQATLDAALALVEETGARSYLPFIHVARAELAQAAGDAASRRRELREAHRLFTEMSAPIRAAAVGRELQA